MKDGTLCGVREQVVAEKAERRAGNQHNDDPRIKRLKELLAEDKKDDGLVFDELGVDYLFIDEAHYFKNLETPTKMERVAGIQTGGSERAFDLYMKVRLPGRAAPRPRGDLCDRHSHLEHDGRDVHDATVPRPGGPLGPRNRALRRLGRHVWRGGRHDGDFAGRGELEATEPVRGFVNLPELQQMFRSFSDVQTAAMLDLPPPHLREASRPSSHARCRMSNRIQVRLVDRYERIRLRKSIREKKRPGHHHRRPEARSRCKAHLGGRARILPVSKTNALVERVVDVWRETEGVKGSQLVFCDLGRQSDSVGILGV